MKNKVFASFDEAVADIPDGASIAMESWGPAGTAQNLIAAIKRKGLKDLTIITHNLIPAIFSEEQAVLPSALLPQMKKLITAVVGIQQLGAGAFVKEYVEKGLEVEFTSHGTLPSRLLAGATGLGAIYSPIGVGTILEEGKEKRVIDGKEYIYEKPILPDYAFIMAHKADKMGNLYYLGTHRMDQPVMAMAAKVTIAEVDEIVEVGEIDPEHVVTPGIFVDRIVNIPEGSLGSPKRRKELVYRLHEWEFARKRLFRQIGSDLSRGLAKVETGEMKERLNRDTIAMRAARELRDGDYANLGVGIPRLCALYMPEGVILHSENGALGYGPPVMEDEVEKAELHYIDGAGRFFTPVSGMALCDVLTSVAMIRGGRLITILGAFEISGKGDLANWNAGTDALGGTIGGGMDLVVGAKRVIITMEHTTKEGKPKIVKECIYPLTAKKCVDLIVTDLAVIEVTMEGLLLREVAPGWTAEEVQALTEPKLIVAAGLKEIEL